MNKYTLSSTGIDSFLWDIRFALWKRHSESEMQRLVSPLVYWINTGRASTSNLKALLSMRICDIVKALELGGSDEEVISRLRNKAERKARQLERIA